MIIFIGIGIKSMHNRHFFPWQRITIQRENQRERVTHTARLQIIEGAWLGITFILKLGSTQFVINLNSPCIGSG